MKLATLYWHYTNLPVTKNHLELFRQTNPTMPVFGLYGGAHRYAKNHRRALQPMLQDWWESPWTDSEQKWIHGDLMILDWYNKHGKFLEWDSIAIVQWDMLVFSPLEKLFPRLRKDQIVLSGQRPLDANVENRWSWTRPDREHRSEYLEFVQHMRDNEGYIGKPQCCLYIFEIIPRKFFEKYTKVKNQKLGMLEYKIPMYAKAWHLPFYKKDLGVWWFENRGTQRPMNARPRRIPAKYIQHELKKPNGWRMFHPYFTSWSLNS